MMLDPEYVEIPEEPYPVDPLAGLAPGAAIPTAIKRPQALNPLNEPASGNPTRLMVMELFDDSLADQSDLHRSMAEELDFVLKGDQWEKVRNRTGSDEDILPTGAELFHLERHKWSKLATAPIYIECRPWPGQEIDGAEDAELAKALIESVVYDRRKRYRVKRRTMMMGAIAARAWVMAADYSRRADQGRGGVVFRTIAPWHFGVAPGWNDIHDPTCPFVWELADMRVQDVFAMRAEGWTVPDSLVGDSGGVAGAQLRPGESSQSPYGAVRLTRESDAQHRGTAQTRVEVVKMWFRYNDEEAMGTPEVIGPQPLPPDQQYLMCPVCGYTDDGESVRDPQTGELPASGPDCPQCGQSDLQPVMQSPGDDPYGSYPAGRLVIVARNQDVVFYDDAWPFRLRSYPFWYCKAYEHPIDLVGMSDTALHWESQQLLNGTIYFGWEQLRRNVDILIAPWQGLVDHRNMPFKPTNEHGQMAFFKSALASQGIKHVQGSGVAPALMPFHQLLAQRLQMHTGTQDLSLSPSQIASATVGAVEAAEKQGEIPLDDHLEAMREDESVFLGVVLDMHIGFLQEPRRLSYERPDGEKVEGIASSASLPALDVNVAASPSLASVKAEEITSFVQWATLPPHLRLAVAKLANIPLSYVRELQMAEAAMAPDAPEDVPPDAPTPKPAGEGGPPTAGA